MAGADAYVAQLNRIVGDGQPSKGRLDIIARRIVAAVPFCCTWTHTDIGGLVYAAMLYWHARQAQIPPGLNAAELDAWAERRYGLEIWHAAVSIMSCMTIEHVLRHKINLDSLWAIDKASWDAYARSVHPVAIGVPSSTCLPGSAVPLNKQPLYGASLQCLRVELQAEQPGQNQAALVPQHNLLDGPQGALYTTSSARPENAMQEKQSTSPVPCIEPTQVAMHVSDLGANATQDARLQTEEAVHQSDGNPAQSPVQTHAHAHGPVVLQDSVTDTAPSSVDSAEPSPPIRMEDVPAQLLGANNGLGLQDCLTDQAQADSLAIVPQLPAAVSFVDRDSARDSNDPGEPDNEPSSSSLVGSGAATAATVTTAAIEPVIEVQHETAAQANAQSTTLVEVQTSVLAEQNSCANVPLVDFVREWGNSVYQDNADEQCAIVLLYVTCMVHATHTDYLDAATNLLRETCKANNTTFEALGPYVHSPWIVDGLKRKETVSHCRAQLLHYGMVLPPENLAPFETCNRLVYEFTLLRHPELKALACEADSPPPAASPTAGQNGSSEAAAAALAGPLDAPPPALANYEQGSSDSTVVPGSRVANETVPEQALPNSQDLSWIEWPEMPDPKDDNRGYLLSRLKEKQKQGTIMA